MKFSRRAERIEPFYVMEIAKAAQALAREVAGGPEPMIFLNIGEPDFTAPPLVREAADRALRSGATQYTNALGLDALRERISGWYAERFGVAVPARRIVVTAGASGALQLACLALIEQGDEVLMPDPSYPCNRHFVSAADGRAVLVPSTAAERFQLSADKVAAHWGPQTRGVLLASPSNPTGTSIAPDELRRIHAAVQARDGFTLIDEIYLGLSYEEAFGHTALAIGEDIVSINSFSKYFNMTGWRLGWMVVPEAMVPVVERLAQNLFICPSTVAQHAALACFEPDSIAEYERRRAEFKARRDYFIPALESLGLSVPVRPDGAFYAWADCTAAARHLGVEGSWDFAHEVMRRAHLALTPGRDFGSHAPETFVRFSTANSMAQLQEAVARLSRLLA
ncbi:Aspartate transaminase [Paracidovorax avenae ATCC 19860]|uniref:Aminotransferase n=1 Tax=Paracidovorax avenae (strain ATCC 19860 / DSM 7227 / CCUG 15838 / JCM 20985 / LMG 2117 / NCPPB 1011) TaxID=643561 RepID=F0Q4X9_PARA1|nr:MULTISPECIES: pyridoxal phosphate-dependent aminotransferase [Comamonadaceae]ADX46815.1 Aspartate transaminase [Paracidovorax avenae ATCC 19860]MDA8449350.1 pyridoxal phosphate-dependent aminotransferase [Acidovorax sp. GBBC 3297]MDA8458561.1 pyridoxal phosphate-dependent aminotransferase [Acidovorax sp. GBBC 3333]MDA8463599.1 pyridoxal phosphate-dependent aminotransferase [Acidovorax sp. GBBC 3332]MDA8468530.1 pyridoxal phosphate-dependent aminotransferase [Acidovorax sp. GBBC 3299]